MSKQEAELQQAEAVYLETENLYRELYFWERKTREMVQFIRQACTPDELYPQLVSKIGQMLELDRCFIIHFQDHQSCPIEYEYLKHEEVPSIVGWMPPYEAPFLYSKIGSGYRETLFIEDIASLSSPDSSNTKTFTFRGFVRLPIIYQEHLLANLILQTLSPRSWHTEETYLLSTLSEQLAITLYQGKLLKELETATQLKSMFLANMSHELRTPLNAIIGYSEMMANGMSGSLNEKQTRYIQNVAASGKHLLTLVNDILDLSKIESGKVSLDVSLFELPRLLQEVANTIKPLADTKHLRFDVTIDPHLMYALADPARLKQILYNLLSNAIKFTETGGHVRLQAYASQDQKNLVLHVIDSGIGFAVEDYPKVFCEFVRINNAYAQQQEGSGLGLALTQKLVTMHGGTITFESQEGAGTMFTVQMPCLVNPSLHNIPPFLLHC